MERKRDLTSPGARGIKGEREGAKRREQDRDCRLPSEKFGVLHVEDVEQLAALVAGLGEWTRLLCALLEDLNCRLTIQPPHGPAKPLSFYKDREHPHQAPLWEGLDDREEV